MNFQSNNEHNFYDKNTVLIHQLLEYLHSTFLKLVSQNLLDNGLLWLGLLMDRKHPQSRLFCIKQDINENNPLFNLNVLMDMTSGSANNFSSLFAKTLIDITFEHFDFAEIIGHLLKTHRKNEVSNWYLNPIGDAYGYYLVPYVHITHGRLSQVEIFLKMKPLSKLVEP